MAKMNPDLKEELVRLGQELYEGDITRNDYDKTLTQLLSRYDAVPGEAYHVEHRVEDPDIAYTFPPTTNHSGLEARASQAEASDFGLMTGIDDSIVTFTEPPCRPTSTYTHHTAESTSLSVAPQKVTSILASAEAFVKDWTPCLLVCSYFIFSTCLYMLCNGELISIFWFIYLVSNFYIAASTVRSYTSKTFLYG